MARLPAYLLMFVICPVVWIPVFADVDGDGVRDDEDICPLLYNPEQIGRVKLNPPLGADRDVSTFAISPDSSRVVYRADQDTDGLYELFSVPIDQAGEVKLNPPLVPAGDVEDDYLISPDGRSVLYRADYEFDTLYALLAASIEGGEVLRLSMPPPAGGPIQGFDITSDGSRFVYLGDPEYDYANELYSILLYTDADADGVYGSCDCAPHDDLLWTTPQEVSGLTLKHSGSLLVSTTLTWSATDYNGGADRFAGVEAVCP